MSVLSVLSVRLVADLVARHLRRGMARMRPDPDFAHLPARVRTLRLPTRHGEVTCTAYSPEPDAPGPPGVCVNFHGGGFVGDNRDEDDPLCRYLAARAGVVVLNVDYGVAPRHRFPVAVEQAYDAVAWAALPDHAWDGRRLCVGGQSAGGALATAAARLALEHGGPRIALQVLHYPPLDLVTPGREKRARGDQAAISPWVTEVFNTVYTPDPATRRDRLASPAWGPNADNLTGIAPALVITCELDRLRDEGASYARSLDAVGALVAHHDLPGVDHGYNLSGTARDLTERMYALIADEVSHHTAAPHRHPDTEADPEPSPD